MEMNSVWTLCSLFNAQVTDENTGVDLPGVLLSLSGGESFRKNAVTQENEGLVFTNLVSSC